MNLFAIDKLDLQHWLMGEIKKREKKWHRHTDRHCNLETESAQLANSVKRFTIKFAENPYMYKLHKECVLERKDQRAIQTWFQMLI